jgi:hypothetical protein
MVLKIKSCPINWLKEYGIHAPQKWKVEDCPECEFLKNEKCEYKQIRSQREQLRKRGEPALVKRGMMTQPAAARKKAETDALKKAGFSADEQKEYWVISIEYDQIWEQTPVENRREILEKIEQWKVHLESGVSPTHAHQKVHEWLKQREDFKNKSE